MVFHLINAHCPNEKSATICELIFHKVILTELYIFILTLVHFHFDQLYIFL